jgi:hypothetical protein
VCKRPTTRAFEESQPGQGNIESERIETNGSFKCDFRLDRFIVQCDFNGRDLSR